MNPDEPLPPGASVGGSQSSPLEPLGGALPPEAFQALHAVLSTFDQRTGTFDQRVGTVENTVFTSQHMKKFIQSAFSNAQFTINASAGAPSSAPPVRINPPKITLQLFSGRTNENVRGWLSTVKFLGTTGPSTSR